MSRILGVGALATGLVVWAPPVASPAVTAVLPRFTETAAEAVPVTPRVAGVPAPNTRLFWETFDVAPLANNGARALNYGGNVYAGVGGNTYNGSVNWTDPALCNGIILNANTPTVNQALTVAGRTCYYTDSIRQLAYILGGYNGTGQLTNRALSQFTAGTPGVGTMFSTNGTFKLVGAKNRFLIGQVNVAAMNCAASAPSLQWQYFDPNSVTAYTNVGGAVNGCTGLATVTAPSIGVVGAATVAYGAVRSGAGFYVSQDNFEFRINNANGSGAGNDFAIDDVMLFDATPAVDKSFSPAVIQRKQTSTLTITITNTADKLAKVGWAFTDRLPTGVVVATPAKGSTTCPNTSFNPNPNQNVVTISSGTLSNGMTSCIVKVDVTSATDGVYPNGASNFTTLKGLLPPPTATLRVSTPSPKISLTKTANPISVPAAGKTVTYTLVAKNTGAIPLTGVSVSDPKLSGLSCTPALSPAPSLAVGASITCTGTHVVTQAEFDSGTFINTASASANSNGGPVSTTASAAVKAVQSTGLAVTKKVTPAVYSTAGTVLSYQMTVQNVDNVTLQNVTVSDPNVTNLSCTPSIPVAALAPGASISCTGTYTVTPADITSGTFTNTVVASGRAPDGSTVEGRRSATAVTNAAPRLEVSKAASPAKFRAAGDVITYTVTARNIGNVPLDNVTVSDAQLDPMVCSPSIPVTVLEVGDAITCQGTYTVTQDDVDFGDHPNSATADGTFNSLPVTHTGELTITAGEDPAITVTKTVSPTMFLIAGETLNYRIAAKNTGNVTLTNVTVSDPRATGLSCSPSLPVASLTPGASVICTATTTSTSADVLAGELVNTASASGTAPSGATASDTDSAYAYAAPQRPAIALNKSVLPTAFTTVGQTLTFTLTATNTGNVPLSDVSISDPKVEGLTCSPGAPVPSLAPGAALTCSGTYVVTQADVDAGTLSNTASVAATPPSGAPLSRTATLVTPGPSPSPRLVLAKVADRSVFAAVGEVVTYTLTATNTGNVTLSNVSITDPKLSSLACSPAAPARLLPGGALVCTGAYTVTQADLDAETLTNTASTIGSPPTGGFVSGNASSTLPALPPTPRLSVVKSASPASFVTIGDTITYTVRISNTGAATLKNIVLTDPLGTPVCSPALSGLQLAPGAFTTCTYTHQVTVAEAAAAAVNNTASASATSLSGAPTSDQAALVTPGPIPNPQLSVVKTAKSAPFGGVGSAAEFTVVVTNTGNVPLSDVAISDPGTVLQCPVDLPIPTLAIWASVTCTAVYTVTQVDVDRGSINNTASATGKDLVNNPVTAADSESVAGPPATPSLRLTKTAAAGTVNAAGEVVGYAFVVTNTGNVSITNVSVSDPRITNVVCAATSLAPGASTNCSGTYVVTQADLDTGLLVNTASAAGTPAHGVLPAASATATVAAVQNPRLSLDKAVQPVTFGEVGQTLTFSLIASNTGNVTLANVTVSDPRLTGLSCSPATPATSLAPGESMICSGTYRVVQADVDAGSVTNTASVSATSPGAGPVSETDSVSVPGPAQAPSLSLSKVADQSSYAAINDVLTFTLVATNTGNTTLTEVEITDPSIPSLSCNPAWPATLAPGQRLTCSGSYVVTQTDLDRTTVTNTASVSGNPPFGATPVGDTASETVNGVQPLPRLAVVKTASPAAYTAPGTDIVWTIEVRNTGLATLKDVEVADERGAFTCDVTLPVAEFPPGGRFLCTLTYPTTGADVERGSVSNTASASGASLDGRKASASDTSVVDGPVADPRLSVVKSAQPSAISVAGESLLFTVVATNTGNVPLEDVTVSDPGLTLSCTPSLPVPTLDVGESITCTGSKTVTQADVDAGSLHNEATADATTPLGSPVTGFDALDVPGPAPAPALDIVKRASTDSVSSAGEVVAYTFLVSNTGNSTIRDVAVSDPLTTGVVCSQTTLLPGQSTSCSGTHVVTQAEVDSGQLVNTATVSGTPARGTLPPASASDTVAAAQTPKLVLDKTVQPVVFAQVGETLVFTLVASNIGNVTLTNVNVWDGTLADLACTPASPIASLAPGESVTCSGTRKVTQTDVDLGYMANSASASGKPPIGPPATSSDTVNVPGPASAPALTLSKVADQTTYTAAGDVLTYTLVATNTGNVTLGNVSITDPKLTGLTCTQPPPAVLAPGGQLRCTGSYTVTQDDVDGGLVSNTALASGTPPGNSPITESATDNVQGTPPVPRLSVVKTASPAAFAQVGESVTWTIEVRNTGLATLTGVTVSDIRGAVTCDEALPIASLAPGEGVTCAYTDSISGTDVERGYVENTASASGTSLDGRPASGSDTLLIDGPVANPRLSVVKTASPATFSSVGETVTFTVVATNSGNVPLEDVAVDDPGHELDCAPSIPVATLAVGASITCDATATVTQADIDSGVIHNEATASGTTPLGSAVSGSDAVDVPGPVATPMLAVDKQASTSLVTVAGEVIAYTFTVTNNGNVTVSAIAVSDPLVGVVACAVTTLAPGAATSCSGTYVATQTDIDRGVVVNTASVTATPARGVLPAESDGTTVDAVSKPGLSVSKRAIPLTYSVEADTITYAIVATNTGNVTLTNVTLSDPLLPALDCAPSQPVASLAPGASVQCTGTYRVTQDDVDGGSVTNSATASGAPPTGAPVSSSDSVDVPGPVAAPQISLSKVADRLSYAAPGEVITYTLTVTNTGNVTASEITISDPKLTGLTCLPSAPARLAPRASMRCTGTYTVTQADVDAGSVTNSASASGTARGVPVSDTATETVPGQPPVPRLTVAKSASPAAFTQVGETITWTIVVRNTGLATLSGVNVGDSMSPVGCDPTIPVFRLVPGESIVCTYSTNVSGADVERGSIINTATAYATTLGGDPLSASDTLVVDGPVPNPRLSVVKTSNPIAFTAVGEIITFTVVATNTGNVPLEDVTVSDPGLTLDCGRSLPVAELAVGESITCTATRLTTQADVDAGTMHNEATADGTTPLGDPVSGGAVLDIPGPVAAPSLRLLKSVVQPSVSRPGQAVNFVFDVTNTGNVTIENLAIVDSRLDAPAVCATNSLAPGGSTRCSGTYTTKNADLFLDQLVNTATATGDPERGNPGSTFGSAAALVAVQELPPTGGGSTGLPWALLVLATGLVFLAVSRRRPVQRGA